MDSGLPDESEITSWLFSRTFLREEMRYSCVNRALLKFDILAVQPFARLRRDFLHKPGTAKAR